VPIVFVWLAVTSCVWLIAGCNPALKDQLDNSSAEDLRRFLPRHPITLTERLRLWPQCWRFDLSDSERYALWDKLRLHPPHEAVIGWEELAEVRDFLRAQDVKDREVIAWFDSPHAVYLMLDLDPGFRYMHVYTAISISVGEDVTGETGRKQVLGELRETQARPGWPKFRYVVSDLEWVALAAGEDKALWAELMGPPRNPPNDLLPVHTPYPDEFPFNQPTVFRTRNGTGRYVVHRIIFLDDSKK
jgi:hypothetical protein